MTVRVGDRVFFRMDDTNVPAQITRVVDGETIDIVLHDDNGRIIGGIPEVPRATIDAHKKTDGYWWPK